MLLPLPSRSRCPQKRRLRTTRKRAVPLSKYGEGLCVLHKSTVLQFQSPQSSPAPTIPTVLQVSENQVELGCQGEPREAAAQSLTAALSFLLYEVMTWLLCGHSGPFRSIQMYLCVPLALPSGFICKECPLL